MPGIDADAIIAAAHGPGDRGACSSTTATRPARRPARPTEFQDKHANTDGRVRYTAPSIKFANGTT